MTHTPGPWEWWTSNSWNRLRHSERGVSTNVLLPSVCRDGQPTIDVSQDDMALIAAAPAYEHMWLSLSNDLREHMLAECPEWVRKSIVGAAPKQPTPLLSDMPPL